MNKVISQHLNDLHLSSLYTPIQKMPHNNLSEARAKYFEKLKTNDVTQPIYPHFPQGPHFLNSREQLPKNRMGLFYKCLKNYSPNPTSPQLSVTLSEVIDSLKETRDSVGLAIHLLHLYPFSMIDNICVDGKHGCASKEQIVDTILRHVLNEGKNMGSMLWISVPNDNALKNILKEEARLHKISTLPDPLHDKGGGSWATHMVLEKLDRKYNNSDNVLGSYIISKQRMETKFDAMKRHFEKFQPHYILDHHCPIEISTIKRLRKACDLFRYGYNIEKMKASKNNHLAFIRVPDDIHQVVDMTIKEKGGCASLNFVMKKVMKFIETEGTSKMELFRNAIIMMRHISHGEESLQCNQDRRWVFALNRDNMREIEDSIDEDGSETSSSDEEDMAPPWQYKENGGHRVSTMIGNKLELSQENLGKTIFRSLSSMEEMLGADFTDYERSKDLLKHTIIGLPHGCNLRSKTDPTKMCRMRFSDIQSKFVHIRGHHRMSQEIQNTLEALGNKSPCQLQSEEEWLDDQGIFHVYDQEQLMRKENIGDLYHQFYRLHLSLKQAITSLFELRQETDGYYKDMISKKKTRMRYETDKSKIKEMKKEIRQFVKEQQAFVQEEEVLAAWVLTDKVFEDHILALERAVAKQKEVNDLFHRHGHELQQMAMAKADLIGAKLVDGWRDAIHKSGGKNIASISPEHCMQHLGSDQNSGSNMFETVILGLAGQQVRHKAKAIEIHHLPYKEGMGDSDQQTGFLQARQISGKVDISNEVSERPDRERPLVETVTSEINLDDCTPSTEKVIQVLKQDDQMPIIERCRMLKDIPLGIDDRTLPPSNTKYQSVGHENLTAKSLVPYNRSMQANPPAPMCVQSICTIHRKRGVDKTWMDEPSELIKLAKYSEKLMANDRVLTLDQYSTMERWSNSSTIKIDARHFSPNDIRRFVGGTKMLPGSQIVRVGKGSDEGTTTYEPIDPRTIYVDVRDFKDLLFYLICLMRRSDMSVSLYKILVVKAFMNVLNIMFALTESGSSRMQKSMDWVIRKNTSPYRLDKSDKERMWITFLNAVTTLNCNRSGQFTDFFSVRLSRHGDASMIPIKIAPEHSFSYEREGHIDDLDMYQLLSSIDIPYNVLDSQNMKMEVNHQDFFARQGCLISKLRKQYQSEITLFHDKKPGAQLVMTEEIDNIEKHWKRPPTKAIIPKHPENASPIQVPQWEYIMSQSSFMKQHKKDLSVHRSFDMTPTQKMSDKDLDRYDAEINHVRSKTCVICLDPFENRPLEGLNCVYKELEIDFRTKERIQDNVRLEMNTDLWKRFQGYVSECIDKKAMEGGHDIDVVEANGMHLFHRSCLRQYIQLKTLELGQEPIKCPICNAVVYSINEKANILRNIDELSSRLGEYAMSDVIASYNTDDLINLKNDPGANTLSRYFQSNALGDKKDMKEDQNILDEVTGVVKPVDIDFLKKKDPAIGENIRESYINFAIKSNDRTFNPSWLAKTAINSNIFETRPIECC